MVWKYQNEISPIFYLRKKAKNIRKTPKNTWYSAPPTENILTEWHCMLYVLI